MHKSSFFGRKVVAATFVMAVFGWGIGFYGPPIFMYAVIQKTGWSAALCSAAVTVHFLAGTLVVINLPALYNASVFPGPLCQVQEFLLSAFSDGRLPRSPINCFLPRSSAGSVG